MVQSPPTNQSQPLTIGNIFGTTIQLYVSQFYRYFLIALRAAAWPLGIIIATSAVLGGIIALIVIPLEEPTPWIGLAILVSIIVWCGFYLYGFAKFLANSALISKLAFNQLTDSTETPRQACEGLKPITWAFLRITLYLGILYLIASLALSFISSIIIAIPFGVLSAIEAPTSATIFLGFFGLLYLFAVLFFFLWLFSRWFLAEVVLAVEDNNEAGESISRSWNLSEGISLKLMFLIAISLFMTLPIFILQLGISFSPEIAAAIGLDIGRYGYLSLAILGPLLSVFIGLLLLPFWQVIKAVVYRDLKIREERLQPGVEPFQHY